MIRWLKFPWVRSVLALTLLVVPAVPGHAKDRDNDRSRPNQHRKLDKALNRRAVEGGGTSRVIVVFKPGSAGTEEIGKHGSKSRRRFWLVNAQTADVPNSVLKRLADDPAVESIHEDRPTRGELNRVAVSVGARAVQTQMGDQGRRRRRGRDRFGDHVVARRPDLQRLFVSRAHQGWSARGGVCRLRQRPHLDLRRQRSRQPRRRHDRWQRLRHRRRSRRYRA